jgi:hypothetical protein
MNRKSTAKKTTAKTKKAKSVSVKKPAAKKKSKPAKTPLAKAPRTPAAKRLKVFVVQRKTFGVYGDTLYTDPDRVFATEERAKQYADTLNRELLTVGTPFEYFDVSSLIGGGDKSLTALVTRLGLPLPTTRNLRNNLDWTSWWNANYFNITDAQRNELCLALDRFEWYQVRTTTLE